MKIKSDILEKEYNFELGNQSFIEKKVILEYKVLTLNDGNNYFYEHKFIPEDEKIVEQIPRLDLD